jgi:cell pole-organizing protein PopZ
MEDILASIRRILNDDPNAAAAPAMPPAAQDDDVLVLDDSMLVRSPGDVAPDPVAALDPAPKNSVPEDAAIMADIDPTPETLMAPQTESAAAAALGSLMRKLADDRAPPVYRGGPTLEDLVREEIRPILKAWLDNQLPELVERLVRVEIERLTAKR